MPDVTEKTKREPHKPLISTVMEWTVWPIAAVAGWWTANESARNALYDTIRHGAFDQHRNEHWKVNEQITKTAAELLKDSTATEKSFEAVVKRRVKGAPKEKVVLLKGTLSKTTDWHGKPIVSINEALGTERKRYGKVTAEFMENLGFRNTIDYFKGIHPSEGVKALAIGTGTALFTIGVIYTMAESKTFQRLFSGKEKDDSQNVSK